MWKWTCPVCGKEIEENYTIEEIKEYIGATHDCPECGGLVMIEKDCTCSDFGKELVRRYSEMGLNVSKEEASNSYIEF
jgi:predicted RNA-binding Zn-ribbon protein involved in translation (DUF1610 family)